MPDLRKSFDGPWAGPVALALLHAIIALNAYHPAPFTGGDDAAYLSLARSLIERHDYTDVWDPALRPHTQFPPIFPVIVAFGLILKLDPAVGMKYMMILISTGAVFASCVWLRRVTTAGVAFCAGFFLAISPEVFVLGQEILSDPLFWLFSMLALLAWRRAARPDGKEISADPFAIVPVVIATTATLAAYFTRSAGAPLLLAVVLWLAMRKQFRAIAIVAAMSAPFIFAWWLRGHLNGGGGYLAPFIAVDPYNPSLGTVTIGGMFERAAKNAVEYSSAHLSRLVFGTPKTGVVFGTAFAAAMFYGWARRLRKPGLAEVWLPIYLTLVILWPVTWSGPRFLFPVIPLFALYVGDTINSLAKAASHPRIFAAAILLAGIVTVNAPLKTLARLGTVCRAQYANGADFPCTDPTFEDFFETAEKIRGRLPANSVVLSRKPTIFYLHSGYRSALYPLSPVPDSLFNLAKRIGAGYVVVDQIADLAPKYLHPIMLARRDDFCVIPELSTDNAALARIEIGGPPRPPGSAPNSFRSCPLTTTPISASAEMPR
ncbi:MAG TPA: hypothetical protein VF042_00045 [Gemmatimonadaceae bacterium]